MQPWRRFAAVMESPASGALGPRALPPQRAHPKVKLHKFHLIHAITATALPAPSLNIMNCDSPTKTESQIVRMQGWPEGAWTIHWYGRFLPAQIENAGAQIEILLRRSEGQELQWVQAGIGSLGLLPLGAQVRDGEVFPQTAPGLVERTFFVGFPGGAADSNRKAAGAKLEDGLFLIPPFKYRLQTPDNLALRSPVYQFTDEDSPIQILIPAAEFARNYLLRTSKLANELTIGPLQETMGRLIQEPIQIQPDGSTLLRLPAGIGPHEAYTVVMLASDHAAQHCFNHFYGARLAAIRQGRPAYLDFPPPLAGFHRVRALGVPIRGKDHDSFLVLRLDRLPWPALPSPLAIEFERNERADEDDLDAPTARYPGRDLSAVDLARAQLLRKRAPNMALTPQQKHSVIAAPPQMAYESRSRINKVHVIRPGPQKNENAASDGSLSTAPAVGGGTVRPLHVIDPHVQVVPDLATAGSPRRETVAPRISLPPTFGELLGAVELLPEAWQTSIHPGTLLDADEGYGYWEFPAAGRQTWPHMDGGRRRRCLCIALHWQRYRAYVLEIERRSDKNDKYCTLVLSTIGGLPLTGDDFRLILSETTQKSGVWQVPKPFQYKRLMHRHGERADFANKIRLWAEHLVGSGTLSATDIAGS